ncbi:MAG: Lrp/AsnC family transcriptional regulator [Rhodospirillaceae bacterium]|nr:Lrp/AsnC family transcriptional regulator [Rhodospirillaceae bacterium]
MDAIDRKILDYVQERGRDTYAEIGAAVGLSVSAINERLKKLERAGVIRHWGAMVEPKAVGRGVLAFMLLLIDRPENEKRLVEAICALPQVLECHHVTGDWSYLIKLRLGDVSEIETVLADTIKQNPGAIRTHTVLALSSRKETSAILGLGAE